LSGTASEAAMPLGELRWRNATQAAVRSSFVVVPAPCRDHDPRLVQRLEPLLVQAFVAQLAVEVRRSQLRGAVTPVRARSMSSKKKSAGIYSVSPVSAYDSATCARRFVLGNLGAIPTD